MYRDLKFTNLDEILNELDKIEKSAAHHTTGVWSYYQIINHISLMIEYSMSDYPTKLPKIVRMTVGKIMKFVTLSRAQMSPGLPNPIAPTKREEGDFKTEVKVYKERIQKFKTYKGKLAEHPVFGELDFEEWVKLHSMHAAHHLSYVEY